MTGKLTREKLEQRLLNLPALEGEGKGLQPDDIYAAVEEVKQQRQHFNNKQQALFDKLLPRLQQPAILLTQEQRQQLLAITDLAAEHDAFAVIKNLIENLEKLQRSLLGAEQQQANPQLPASLQTLITQYQNYLTQLCQSPANLPERQKFLEPPAQLIAEGLGAFTLSQALARKLLCRNELGQKIKENETGNRAVVSHGGIHFKPNYPLLKEYIAPGVEYTMYSLHQMLGDDAIAPTITVKIRHVLTQKDESPEPLPQYFERAVQAGLTIEGMLLQDILRLIQMVDLLKEKLGAARFPAVLDDLLNLKPLEKLLLEFPNLKNPTADNLLEAFCGYMMRFDKGEHLLDFDDWQQRNAANRGRIFESFAQYPQEALFTYSIIRVYPELMAKQKLALLLEIPFAIKTIKKLYPHATTAEIVEQLSQLWDKFDTDNFSILCIGSLMCNPTDAKADNFMVEIVRDKQQQIQTLRIVGIDNDKAFAPAIAGRREHKMLVKNILYFFPHMQQPIADTLLQHLLRHTPEELITKWLLSLHQQNQYTANLMPVLIDGEAVRGRKLEEVEDASDYALLETGNIPIRLSPGILQEVYGKLKLIKQRLQESQQEALPVPPITHQALLELVEPVVSHYYQALKQKPEYRHPIDALQAIYGGKHSLEELLNEGFELVDFRSSTDAFLETAQHGADESNVEDSRTQTIEAAAKSWVQEIDWELLVNTKQLQVEQVIELLNNLAEQFSLPSLSLSPHTATTWLRLAVGAGLTPLVKLLLSSKADITQTDEVGRTALHLLTSNFLVLNELRGKEQVSALAEILIHHSQAPINAQDEREYTPLHHLCVTEETYPLAETIARLLIYKGANIELGDKERGETPLERSIRRGDVLAFCLLISLGAGGKTEASSLLAFIDKHSNKPQHQARLQTAQKQLAQQNSLFAWQLSLRRLTQATKPMEAEIKEHCKGFYKSFNFEIEGALSGKRYLRPEIAKRLFDKDGIPNRSNHHGRRPVVYLEDNDIALHVKFYPELPGVEEAVQVLSQQVLGYSLVPSELFRFISPQGEAYPVLISQHVPGVKLEAEAQHSSSSTASHSTSHTSQSNITSQHKGNVQELFNHLAKSPDKINDYFDKLDSKSFSELLLLTFLTNPEDGKPDNFVLQPYTNAQGQQTYRLVGVDNDHAFVEPIIRNAKGQRDLQVKTLVYCLNQMEQPLHPEVINAFLKLDPLTTLRKWLKILIQRQHRYEQLFPLPERASLLQRGKSWFSGKDECPVVIPIPFAPKSVVQVYEKFIALQRLLGAKSQIETDKLKTMTGIDLLRRILPFVGLRYQAAFKQADSNPSARFHHVAFTLYSSAIAGNYGMSVTGRQLLKTSNIPEEQLLQAQSPYSPQKAYDELEIACLEYKKLGEVKWQLLQGYINPFRQLLLNSSKEKILESIDFQPLAPALQNAILEEALKGINFLNLTLKNITLITDIQLIRILEASPSLRRLQLISCPNVTESFLSPLSDECQTLEKFTLCQLPKLQRLEKVRAWPFANQPLIFPQLQQLTLIGMPQLHTWQLESSQLKKLTLESCPSISHLQVHRLVSNPCVETLVVKHCPQLNEKALFKVMLCQNQQWATSHIKPFMEGECLNLQGLPITDKSLALIAERQLPFQRLDLRGCNQITFDGLLALMHHESLTQINQLDYTATGKSLATLKGHTDIVSAMAILPDGRIVSGSEDNTLRIWDANSLVSTATLKGHTDSVLALASLPDGRIVSGSADKTLRIWDASTHQSLATLKGHTNWVIALAVLSDGRIISGSGDNTLRIWDANTHASTATLNGHTSAIMALTILPDGRIVSGSDDKTLRIWDVSNHQCVATLKGHTYAVTALAVLPDGRIVSGSGYLENILRIWDANSLASTATLTGHTSTVLALAILPDGRIVSGSDDNTLRIWDANSLESIATLKGHTGSVSSLAILPDGCIVSGSADKTLRLWSFPDLGLNYAPVQALKSKWSFTLKQEVLYLAASAMGASYLKSALETLSKILPPLNLSLDTATNTLIITCADEEKAYQLLRHLQALQPTTINCSVLPSSINDAEIEHWLKEKWRLAEINLPACATLTQKGLQKLIGNFPTLQKISCFYSSSIATLKGHTNSVLALAILPDGRIVSGSYDKTLRIWDANSLVSIATLKGHSYAVLTLAVLQCGRVVSGSDDKTLRIWDVNSLKCLATLQGHTDSVRAVAILHDGQLLSGSNDKTLRLWDADTQQCLAILRGHSHPILALAILPDGRIVSGSADKTLRIWDASTFHSIATLNGHTDTVTALAVLSNGNLVSGSSDYTLRIWDIHIHQCIATLQGHTKTVNTLAVLPGGYIASGSSDKTLRIWDAKSLQSIATLEGHYSVVNALAVLQDGRFVSGCYYTTLRLWNAGNRHLDLLLLDKRQPQLTQHESQLKLNFDVANHLRSVSDDEMQAVISTYQNIIQLCFGLMPSAKSNSLCLTYHCQNAKQAADIGAFLQQCWNTRKQNRQQALPHTQDDKSAVMPQLSIYPPFELCPLSVFDFQNMKVQLEANPSLCTLNLAGISLDKGGLNCLLQLIRTNKTLTFINLSHTGLIDSDAKRILDILQNNHSLMRLNLKGNAINPKLLKQIEEHFAHKNTSRLNEVEIPLAELDMSTKYCLGQGAYGEVYRIQWNHLTVAVKELRPTTSETMQKQFKREALMLASFKHPYIVQLRGVNFSDKMRIVMEYVPGGSLQNLLDKQTQPFAMLQLCRYALDIAYGLAFIHDSQILHLDLKPDNILVCADGHLKITDFGTSLLQEQISLTVANKRGTYRYMAPELWVAVDKTAYTKKADCYSYGIILWEIATCQKAYGELTVVNDIALYKHIVEQENRPQPNKPEKTTEGIANLISACWSKRSKDRPKADKIIICLEKEAKSCAAKQ